MKNKKSRNFQKPIDKGTHICYNNKAQLIGSLAQLGEHLPYKQRVRGSSPLASTNESEQEFFLLRPNETAW